MFGHDKHPATSTTDSDEAVISRRLLIRAGLGLGITGLAAAAGCSTPNKVASPAPADTAGGKVGSTAPIDVLKVAQLGVATADKLAGMDDRQSVVDEFTNKASYSTSAEEVIRTQVYLDHQEAFSGTTAAEIDKRNNNVDAYLADVTRFDAPALEARGGVVPENPAASGLAVRHNFVAVRACTMRAYDKNSSYAYDTVTSNIQIIDGSYDSGKFTATYEVALTDNLAGSQALLNDPNIKSIDGKDICKSVFTKTGERWTVQTDDNYEAAKTQG